MKKLLLTLLTAGLLAFSAATASAQTAPKSVIHVVTVAFKEGTTPAQIDAAIAAVQKLPSTFKGITHVWTKAIKVQNAEGAKVKKTHVFVMEFASEAALKEYDGSDAQKEFYKSYLDIRAVSTTFDITN
ncbi:MAG: Dabb family protein [Verrucomicrobia bacterium]|nr:Dabb family protein [Verrucomicrobiota bacterium]